MRIFAKNKTSEIMIQQEVDKAKENINSGKVETLSHQTTNMISDWSKDFLHNIGIPEHLVNMLNAVFLFVLLVILVYIVQWVIKKIIDAVLIRTGKLANIQFLHHLQINKFSRYLAMIVPISIVLGALPIILSDYPQAMKLAAKGMDIFLVFYFIWFITSVVNAFGDLFRGKENYKDKPIESFTQIIRIFLYFIGIIVIIALLIGKNPVHILTGLGAASAILLLIFKDTILGFVASIQVTMNDMVRIGDWVTMPKFNADGDVLQITLSTVKVQNFDKTITMVPTYSLISDSFQNWRGMQDAGARRIKRSIVIKQSSIRFIDEEKELESFKKIQGINDYIRDRFIELSEHNENLDTDNTLAINGRHFTNLGLFRKYVEWYLKNHPDIAQDMILMVRLLAPDSKGVPMEIYVFVKTTVWEEYENIMSDIMSHISAAVCYFDLEIFEDISNPVLTNNVSSRIEEIVKSEKTTPKKS